MGPVDIFSFVLFVTMAAASVCNFTDNTRATHFVDCSVSIDDFTCDEISQKCALNPDLFNTRCVVCNGGTDSPAFPYKSCRMKKDGEFFTQKVGKFTKDLCNLYCNAPVHNFGLHHAPNGTKCSNGYFCQSDGTMCISDPLDQNSHCTWLNTSATPCSSNEICDESDRECQETCFDPPDEIQGIPAAIQNTCTTNKCIQSYDCPSGNETVQYHGGGVIECMNGTWLHKDDIDPCSRECLETPVPIYNESLCDSPELTCSYAGCGATVSCIAGFQGGGNAVCNAIGQWEWSSFDKCVAFCGVPTDVPKSKVSYKCETQGCEAVYTCDGGYSGGGSKFCRNIGLAGIWDGDIVCVEDKDSGDKSYVQLLNPINIVIAVMLFILLVCLACWARYKIWPRGITTYDYEYTNFNQERRGVVQVDKSL